MNLSRWNAGSTYWSIRTVSNSRRFSGGSRTTASFSLSPDSTRAESSVVDTDLDPTACEACCLRG